MSRFYQTEYIKPQSAYVELPIPAMAAKLQGMQALQDQYTQGLELMDKPFNALENDMISAQADKQTVQSKLEALRNLDYNDSNNRTTIYNSIKEVRDMYGPQGEIGLKQAKYNQYNAEMQRLDKMAEKDPVKASVLKMKLVHDAKDQDRAIQKDPTTGQYINTSITPLNDWEYKDTNDTFSKYLKDVMMEAGVISTGWQGTPADAVKMYQVVSKDERTKQKIDYALRNRVAGDPNLIMSAQADALNSGQQTDEFNFWTPKIDPATGEPMKDSNGNIIYGWNQDTLIGRAAEGAAAGYVETKKDVKVGTVTDRPKEEEAIQKMKERNALVLSGQIPGTTTTIDAERNAANITDLTTQLKSLPNTPQNLAQRQQLQKQLEIAQAYQTQIMNAAAPTDGYKTSVDAQWSDIENFRKNPSSRSGFVNDPFMTMMNSKEGNQKIKTKADYDAWLRGEITIGSGPVMGGIKGTNQEIFDENSIRGARRDMTLANVKELEDGSLNITQANTVLWGDKESGVGQVNGALTDFVKNTPTNFIAQDGSSFQQWQADNQEKIQQAGEGVEMRVSVTHGPEGDVYYASYVDKNGFPITGTTIQPVNDNTATVVRNTVGNKLVNVYSTGTTEEAKKYTRLGQEMIATSASDAGASANEPLLVGTADAIPNPPKGQTSTKVIGETTVQLSQGGQTTIKYRVSKTTDNKGQTTTLYTPLNSKGENIYAGKAVPGSTDMGSFTNIKDMQIALAKDDLGLSQDAILKQELPTQPR